MTTLTMVLLLLVVAIGASLGLFAAINSIVKSATRGMYDPEEGA